MTGYTRVKIPGPINTFGQIGADSRDPHFTPYTVTKDPESPYATIQSAITAAKAQAAIDSLPKLVLVGPGTWLETLEHTTGGEEITVRGEADSTLGGRDLKSPSFVPTDIEGSVIIQGNNTIEDECIEITLSSTSDSTIRFENITFFDYQNSTRIVKIQGIPTGTHLIEFLDCRMVKKVDPATADNAAAVIDIFSAGQDTTITFRGCYVLQQQPSNATTDWRCFQAQTTKSYNLNLIDCHITSRVDNSTLLRNQGVVFINSSTGNISLLIDGCEITGTEGMTGDTASPFQDGIRFTGSMTTGQCTITNNLVDVLGTGIKLDSFNDVYTGTGVTVSDNIIHWGRSTGSAHVWGIYIAGTAFLTTEMHNNLMDCHQVNATFRNACDMINCDSGAYLNTRIIVRCSGNRFLGVEAPGNTPNTYTHKFNVGPAFDVVAIHGEPTKR